jgi:hypothetical protein
LLLGGGTARPDEETDVPSIRADTPISAQQSGNAALAIGASYLAAAWALFYALYRGYYALGGTFAMFGIPVSESQWRLINAIGAGILLVAAAAPIVLLKLWCRPRLRPALLALCWVVTVGCVMHAFVMVAQRVLSLAGILSLDLPFWQMIDQRQSDLQDLLFNEPWFFVEGLLWAAMAWTGALRWSPRRRWWVVSALASIIALTIVGLLSAFGVIGKIIIG